MSTEPAHVDADPEAATTAPEADRGSAGEAIAEADAPASVDIDASADAEPIAPPTPRDPLDVRREMVELSEPHEDPAITDTAELRRKIRRAERAIELVREAFADLGAADHPSVTEPVAGLETALDALRPPEPRKCKEYLRAAARARKGLMGIDPELVVLYCRCFECATLRAKNKLEQPQQGTRRLSPLVAETSLAAPADEAPVSDAS